MMILPEPKLNQFHGFSIFQFSGLPRGGWFTGVERHRYNVLEKLDIRSYVIPICLLGLFLRIFYISHQSIWLDEVASLVSAKQSTIIEVIKTTYITERIPPLYPVFLHFWIKAFGFSECSIRIPSAIFGFLTIPIIYILSKSLFDNRVAILSSLFLAISPFHIWYSQEARYFTIAVFLNLLSILFFLKILKDHNKPSYLYYFFYISSTCLAIYTNYLIVFTIIAQNIIVFHTWLRKKTISRLWFYAQLFIILLCIIPLFLLLAKQALTGYEMRHKPINEKRLSANENLPKNAFKRLDINAAKMQSRTRDILRLIRERLHFNVLDSLKFLFIHTPYSFGTGLKYVNRPPYSWNRAFRYTFILPSILLFILLFVYGVYTTSHENVFPFLILFLVPIIGVFLIKLLDLRPITARHLIQSLPLFYVFVALFFCSIQSLKIKSILLLSLALFMTVSLSIYYFDKKTYKDDWRYVTSYVLRNLTSEDFIIFHGEYPKTSFFYYIFLQPNKRTRWETEKPANVIVRGRDGSFSEFLHSVYDRILVEKKRIWVITYYADQKEKNFLRTHIEKDFRPIQRKSNLGRNLSVELYESLQTTSSMEKLCSGEAPIIIRDEFSGRELL